MAHPMRLRVLHFAEERGARKLPPEALAGVSPLGEGELLWVDIEGEDAPADILQVLGLDVARLDPEAGGEIGLLADGDWKYLYVAGIDEREGHPPGAVHVALALGPNTVVSHRRGPLRFLDGLMDNEADYLRVGRLESTVFAMALLDRMLTDYLDVRDDFETRLDKLELRILDRPRSSHLSELQRMRHLASRLRRILAAQRDLFDALARPDFDPDQSEDADEACRVVSARYARVMDAMEAARELVNGSFDLYTSRAAESTNQAMHTLTVVTVAMGLAATIAGVLGMNFESPVFDTGQRGFMSAAVGIGLLVVGAVGWALVRLLRKGTPPS